VQATMDFVFAEEGVSSVIVGTLSKKHLEYNVGCVSAALERQ
jgi:aryl-alcohol dehydrogenase-like predicted oxidoreductase